MSAESCYPDKAPKVNELLKTLSHPVRREVIQYCENCTGESRISLETLAIHIENRMPSKTREDLWMILYQVHLPILQSRGWLEFETKNTTITYHGHDEAERLLKDVHNVFVT